MAAGGPIQELCQELTCSVCLGYFRNPVILTECGHNFCRQCLSHSWKAAKASLCPQCRAVVQPRHLKPNRQLANMVEIAKKLHPQEGGEETAKGRVLCEKHQEPLKLFCQEDRCPICLVCDRSKEHKDHDVVPVEEAAQEYKDKLHSYAEILKEERRKILTCKEDAGKQTEGLLKQIKSARKELVAGFRKWRQFLEKEELVLLAHMEEMKMEIEREGDECRARLSGELSCLETLSQELEEKVHQPAAELLQDVESILKRCEKKEETGNFVTFNSKLMWRIDNFDALKCFLEADLQKFKDNLPSLIAPQRVNVTLDPDTAHPSLVISKDQKSLRCRDYAHYLPDNPKRFDTRAIVLGCEEFTSGQHFWEVIVACKGFWAVGVARGSVRRKGEINICPQEGFWAVRHWLDEYRALTHPHWTPLFLSGPLERIRVSLSYTEGKVDFFNADSGALLYRFSVSSFNGATLFPYFEMAASGFIKNCHL